MKTATLLMIKTTCHDLGRGFHEVVAQLHGFTETYRTCASRDASLLIAERMLIDSMWGSICRTRVLTGQNIKVAFDSYLEALIPMALTLGRNAYHLCQLQYDGFKGSYADAPVRFIGDPLFMAFYNGMNHASSQNLLANAWKTGYNLQTEFLYNEPR